MVDKQPSTSAKLISFRQPRRFPGFTSFKRAGLFERGSLIVLLLFVLMLPISNARIAATDEAQYYVYLTSLRFDGDFDFANDYARLAELNPRAGIENLLSESRIREKTGLYGNIAPVGSALLWAPFFLLADLFVRVANVFGAGIPADGFSTPYIRAVCYGSAIYACAGLLLCYRMARRYTSQFASTLAVLTIWLATPLVFYMFVQMAFAHANGFFLVSLFLWLWLRTRPTDHAQKLAGRSSASWAALGLVGGLMTITREQLGLFLLLPAIEAVIDYWNMLVTTKGALSKERIETVLRRFTYHVLFLAVFCLTLLPQLATYQALNGEPRPASEVGGKLNLCSPHWIDTLVDFNPRPSLRCSVPDDPTITNPAKYPPFAHGAFLWTPVLPLALLGLILLWRPDRFLAAMLFIAFLAQTYLNGAFGTTWHLTGSFGFRRLIECSPIAILGLAFLTEWASTRIDHRLILALALGFIGWNFALILNWTLFNDVTQLREGMNWPELFRWQIEVPVRLVGKVQALLFDRCSLMENGC